MHEEQFEDLKESLLEHMRGMFEEIEAELARSHEEKFALLEDAVSNATDLDELRVAFEKWYSEHAEDLAFEYEADEIWDAAVNVD